MISISRTKAKTQVSGVHSVSEVEEGKRPIAKKHLVTIYLTLGFLLMLIVGQFAAYLAVHYENLKMMGRMRETLRLAHFAMDALTNSETKYAEEYMDMHSRIHNHVNTVRCTSDSVVLLPIIKRFMHD